MADASWRLYADDKHAEMLVLAQTVDSLISSQVVNIELKLNERTRLVRSQMILYAGVQRRLETVA